MSENYQEQLRQADRAWQRRKLEQAINELKPQFSSEVYSWSKETWSAEIEKRKRIIREFVAEVIETIGNILEVEVLGSTATGAVRPDSDIDLVLKLDEDCYRKGNDEQEELFLEIRGKLDELRNNYKGIYGINIDLSVYRY